MQTFQTQVAHTSVSIYHNNFSLAKNFYNLKREEKINIEVFGVDIKGDKKALNTFIKSLKSNYSEIASNLPGMVMRMCERGRYKEKDTGFKRRLDHLDNWQPRLELKCCKAAKAMPKGVKVYYRIQLD
ncbi:hypothetical protein JEQ12_018345 [Ovis aries]|uniref:Uncharacterized protein n=1 Tax=Ovis aries TaxID=9940 RepID=A0A836A158_SHEEP|nr:hypothetical protein JEQ12_018345 [Ovis aries]